MKEKIKNLKELINAHDNIALFAHIRPDGDSIGSLFALDILLKHLGKNSKIFSKDSVPEIYRFLPDCDRIYSIKDFKKDLYDLIIVVDVSDLDRLGFKADFDEKAQIICIDHHHTNRGNWDLSFINPKKAATCLILYDIISEGFVEFLDEDIAMCLLTGIITDTGGFKYRNTNSEVFKAVSDLVKTGVDYNDLMNALYASYPSRKFDLLKRSFSHAKRDGCVMYTYLTMEDFKKCNALQEDTDGIVNMFTSYRETDISFIFIETDTDFQKISVRSKNIDISPIATEFGGGGHKNAAGFSMRGDFKTNFAKAKEFILNYAEKHIK